MLNSEQIQQIITKELHNEQIQQVSIDLKVIKIEKVNENGAVLCNKTVINQYDNIDLIYNEQYKTEGWLLSPGFYSLTFSNGINIPEDVTCFIKQRSSILRNGCTIESSIYDPNFKCDNLGAFLKVNKSIFIEYQARVASIFAYNNTKVPNHLLYNGQYQKK